MGLKLEARNIKKSFGPVLANNDVCVSFEDGKVYCLLGENGAGKTTLLNILYGIYTADNGEILVNGERARFKSPRDALNKGIYLVQQTFSLIEGFTVAENLALLYGSSLNKVDFSRILNDAKSKIQGIEVSIDPNSPVIRLPMNLRQLVEIQKGLLTGARILLLDEPTSVLTPQEAEHLGTILKRLASEGRIVILTSHKLAQVMRFSDHYLVMRRGQIVYSGASKEITSAVELVKHMFGEDVSHDAASKEVRELETIIEIKNLEVRDEHHRAVVNDASLKFSSGQILGIAAIAGNGQKEFAEAILGLQPNAKGRIILNDKDITSRTVGERRRLGFSYIPEENSLGVVPDFTIAENLSLTTFDLVDSSVFIRPKALLEKAERVVREYSISPPDPNIPARYLSGGNAQKMIVARELSRDLTFLIAYNPTKGLDVKTTAFIHRKLVEKRNSGAAILLISEDLEELLELSDTIAVMYNGRIVGTTESAIISVQELGRMMSGEGRVAS